MSTTATTTPTAPPAVLVATSVQVAKRSGRSRCWASSARAGERGRDGQAPPPAAGHPGDEQPEGHEHRDVRRALDQVVADPVRHPGSVQAVEDVGERAAGGGVDRGRPAEHDDDQGRVDRQRQPPRPRLPVAARRAARGSSGTSAVEPDPRASAARRSPGRAPVRAAPAAGTAGSAGSRSTGRVGAWVTGRAYGPPAGADRVRGRDLTRSPRGHHPSREVVSRGNDLG